MKMTEMAQFI